ncbi:MAG: AI-2E family transporter [Deltaproteobacteria bacterium]|nr:AI-2E family transporter [Deltaproteobacteria bacterium]
MPTPPVEPLSAAPPAAHGPIRRFLARWGLPLFVLLVLVLAREVLLPFIFAALIAYILAPVVRWMTERKDGSRRMPRGLAIILCYLVFIGAIVGFMFVLVPRMAKDIQRIGREAPGLYKRINEEYTPALAEWIEHRFPSLRAPKRVVEEPPVVADVPMPPNTAFILSPLPDTRYAVQLLPGGVEVQPTPGGGYRLLPNETAPEPLTVEQKLRGFMATAVEGLKSQIDGVVKFGQALVGGLITGVFTFFLVLMIGAFLLIDLEKVHGFLRSLFPRDFRGDYDLILRGIDRGLSGVIRGQLLICLINGCFTFIGITIFGIKYGLILSVVAATMSLIPIFGSILSSIPIVFSALVSGDDGLDLPRGLAILAWIVGIHFVEANLLNPKIIGTSAKIHPVLVVFALILGERTFGLVGALLAVPILSMVQVMFVYFYQEQWKQVTPDPTPAPTSES